MRHEDQFPLRRPNALDVMGKEIFAGICGNGEDVP